MTIALPAEGGRASSTTPKAKRSWAWLGLLPFFAFLTLFLIAMSGGPRGARERVFQRQSVRGRRTTAVVIVTRQGWRLLGASLDSPRPLLWFGAACVMAIAVFFIKFSTALGIGSALVQRRSITRRHLQAGLFLSIVVGLALATLTLIGASVVIDPL